MGVRVSEETRTREALIAEIEALRRQLERQDADAQSGVAPNCLVDQALLAETAKALIDFPLNADLYSFIGEQLRQLEGVRFVVISSFESGESEAERSRVRAIAGMDRGLDEVLRILGRSPIGLTLPLAEDSRDALITGSLVGVADLYEITFGEIPRVVCQTLERVFNLGAMHVMGFAAEGRIFGSAVLILHQGAELRNPQLVEGFMGLAAVALRRRQTEEFLEAQRRRLQVLFEEAPVGVTETAMDGRWIRVNRRFCEIVGYSRAELRGMRYQDLTHPDDRVEDNVMARRVLSGQTDSFSLEKRYLCKDGKIIWVSLRVALIRDAEGAPDYFIAVIQDLTERKEMEARLRRQERLAAVGQLAAGIAHDFRNFLSTVILNAQLLMRAPNLSPGAMRKLQAIIDESYKATELVQQILDFGGRTMLRIQPVDLGELTRETVEMLRRTLPETIRLKLEVERGPHRIEADPTRIQSALTNLALNARDAMPEGGVLSFALSDIEVDRNEAPPVGDMTPGSWVRLTVSDTGIGMTADVRSHLFEPFFTTKAVGEGTGLGLAQVFGIVQQHHGHIDVETAPGSGSAFHLYFPISEDGERDGTSQRELEAPMVRSRGVGETLLLVQDEARLREAGRSVLEMLGYRVETAANGREALALCQSPRWAGSPARRIDLVITDLVMPEMGGEALLRELHRIRPDLPFIAVTGYALDGDDLSALRDAGFVAVLTKPIDVDAWAPAIRQALAH